MDAETLSGRSADERGRESVGGRKLQQRCEAVPRSRFKRDQMVSAIFGVGIGRSEPDGRVSQAEAGGPSGLDPGADQSLSGDHLGGAAEFASRTGRLGERNRPDVRRRRKRWKRYQGKADPRKLVFIDETWTKTSMLPGCGWGPKRERVQGWAPFGHWGTSTFIAALRHDRIDAPWVMDGPVNGGSHKTKAVRAAIRGARARLLFLPPCSPDPDPIEQVFAKLKHFLRKDQPRTRDDLWKNIGSILKRFEPEECTNCLENSGYAAVQTK